MAVNPGGLVLAMEPVVELLNRIETRRRESGAPAGLIRSICCGLSNAPGEADFYQVLDPIQHELSGLRKRHFLDGMEVSKIRVELRTLDDVCSELPRLDFIKLDLEGAEFDALHGAGETLRLFRAIIALEQDQYSPSYFGYTWASLLDFFSEADYELYDLFGFCCGPAGTHGTRPRPEIVLRPGESSPSFEKMRPISIRRRSLYPEALPC
jgi:FkbM family methyltransferase